MHRNFRLGTLRIRTPKRSPRSPPTVKNHHLLFPLLLAACAGPGDSGGADAVYRNGRIYTVNPEQPWAEAVAIDEGRFVRVGSNIDDAHNVFEDPLLTPEFELMEGSPAIDAGTAFFEVGGEVVLDLEDSEFDGLAPDLGAIEFVPEPGSLLAHLAATATVAILACRRGRRGTAP